MTKQNLRIIMKNAHKIRKSAKVTMSSALRSSWAIYKVLKREVEKYADKLGARAEFRRWTKYGKDRMYFVVYENLRGVGYEKRHDVEGYVDLKAGKYVAA